MLNGCCFHYRYHRCCCPPGCPGESACLCSSWWNRLAQGLDDRQFRQAAEREQQIMQMGQGLQNESGTDDAVKSRVKKTLQTIAEQAVVLEQNYQR